MATEKAVVTQQYLADIAEAIRAKSGTIGPMFPHEMAAKIAALPSGGGADIDEVIGWITNTSTRIDFTKIAGLDVIPMAVSMLQSGQWFRNNKVVTEVYAPNISSPPAYCFGGCSSLKKVTVYSNGNNRVTYSGSDAIEEIYEMARSAQSVLTATGFLSGIPNTCVVHAVDADVKYVDGAWTIVERS